MAAERPSRTSRWVESLGDGVLAFAQALSAGGVWAGGAAALAMGRFMLSGALVVLGLGIFLRFKRLRMKAKAKATA